MMRKTYRALLFDVDGTLLDFDRSEEECLRVVFDHFGLDPEDGVLERYRSINQKLWSDFEGGRIVKSRIGETRFVTLFQRLGLEADGSEAEKLYREQLDNSAILIEGAHQICRSLSQSYPLYVVTNGTSATQYSRLKKCGLDRFFKQIFVSEDAGSGKPQKEFFDYCLSHMDYRDPEGMLIIGDSLSSDIKGGNAAGIDTCWFNPAGLTVNEGYSVNYEISRLMELEKLL